MLKRSKLHVPILEVPVHEKIADTDIFILN